MIVLLDTIPEPCFSAETFILVMPNESADAGDGRESLIGSKHNNGFPSNPDTEWPKSKHPTENVLKTPHSRHREDFGNGKQH